METLRHAYPFLALLVVEDVQQGFHHLGRALHLRVHAARKPTTTSRKHMP
jgi:hypothetical protein